MQLINAIFTNWNINNNILTIICGVGVLQILTTMSQGIAVQMPKDIKRLLSKLLALVRWAGGQLPVAMQGQGSGVEEAVQIEAAECCATPTVEEPRAGDALVVFSGLAAYERDNGPLQANRRPGLMRLACPWSGNGTARCWSGISRILRLLVTTLWSGRYTASCTPMVSASLTVLHLNRSSSNAANRAVTSSYRSSCRLS